MEASSDQLIAAESAQLAALSSAANSQAGSVGTTWVYALVSAVLVGCSGVVPLLIIPLDKGAALGQRESEKKIRLLLSFAVGGLMGDVFLHLIPEALNRTHDEFGRVRVGLWVIAGVLFFTLLEMILSIGEEQRSGSHNNSEHTQHHNNGANGNIATSAKLSSANGLKHRVVNGIKHGDASDTCVAGIVNSSLGCNGESAIVHEAPQKKMLCGYLNLLANSIDNFTHGLAIGGSFVASTRLGVLTTFAIVVHEIPHEVGDFAILLKSGFGRWEAARAQLATASLSMMGTICALLADDSQALGERTLWILPFTAGGFIQIAMTGVLPEVTKEREVGQCVKQTLCLFAGVMVMLGVTLLCEHHH